MGEGWQNYFNPIQKPWEIICICRTLITRKIQICLKFKEQFFLIHVTSDIPEDSYRQSQEEKRGFLRSLAYTTVLHQTWCCWIFIWHHLLSYNSWCREEIWSLFLLWYCASAGPPEPPVSTGAEHQQHSDSKTTVGPDLTSLHLLADTGLFGATGSQD